MATRKKAVAEPTQSTSTGKKWEVKDRFYELIGKQSLVRKIKSKNIAWFDEDKEEERWLAYAINENTPFVDEFKSPKPRLGHIYFRDGVLHVPKEKKALQQLLSLYHPQLNKVYKERDEEVEATDIVSQTELVLEAMNLAKEMDISKAEAIVRTEVGSAINNMKSNEIKRDLYLMAQNRPKLFIQLAEDENIELINDGRKAVEMGIINLINKNTLFTWASNGNKLLKVGFDKDPYSELARYFKSDDEGVEVYLSVKKQIQL